MRLVVEIAREGGWTPAQVALSWLLNRPGGVIPLMGIRSEDQLRDNLGSLGVTLDPGQTQRLTEASAPSLGFPHDFLRQPGATAVVSGDRWQDIDDPRMSP